MRMILRSTIALFLAVGAAPAAFSQPAPLALDTPAKLSSGATFTAPKGWRLEEKGKVRVMTSPEGDARVMVVDGLTGGDVKSAIASGWAVAQPGFDRAPKLVTPRPGREGWDDRSVFDYETSPNEKRWIHAVAYRKGAGWTAVLYDGAEATTDKRWAAISQVLTSLRAPGYTRESFAGRKANRLDSARVGQLKSFLRTGMEQLGVPGVAYALIQDGKIVDMGGLGVRKLGSPEPIDADTQFMVASNTKGMSTLMLATLVDEGKLKWDRPVTEAYPAFRLGSDAVTAQTRLRHLVCACTGLPRKDLEWIFNTPRDTDPAKVFPLLAATQPTSGFGEVFQYNNLITTAGGFIGGAVAFPGLPVGDAYDRAMQARIFGPLGMKDTHFSFERALKANHASPHGMDVDGRPAVSSHDLAYSIAPYRPAGGAWSTVRDMAKYAQLELAKGMLPNGKRLVSEANLLERRKRGISSGEDQWYGMGLFEEAYYGVPVVFHGGAMPGYMTNFWVIPDAGIGAVLLTNADNGNSLLRPFMRRLLEVVYDGKPEAADNVAAAAAAIKANVVKEREKLVLPPDPQVVAALAPAYANADLGNIKVTRAAGGRVRFDFTDWASHMATRKNDDGTVSLVTIDPSIGGFPFVVGAKDGKRTLTVRDSQHEYVFTEVAR
ncbi:MAG TPA: serine hydrolase domain-containing protein [Allosphingosinicella sp.]|jgi:CubicO group peptidase (beta-lactamase class C family)